MMVAMLWRSQYQTRVAEIESLPSLRGKNLSGDEFELSEVCALVVAESTRALIQLDVWRRMIEPRFGVGPWLAMGVVSAVDCSAEMRAAFAPSRHSRTWWWEAEPTWESLLNPGCAILARASGHHLLMHDLPTEDAWQAFGDQLEQELALLRAKHLER